jgi:hypothetical protein
MGFFSEEYEEQKNLQDNEDIQEIGEDSEVHNTGDNEKNEFYENIMKIADNLVKLAKESKTKNVSKNELQSRMAQEIANLISTKEMVNSLQLDDIKK